METTWTSLFLKSLGEKFQKSMKIEEGNGGFAMPRLTPYPTSTSVAIITAVEWL